MRALWLVRGTLHAVISCIIEFYHTLVIFSRLLWRVNAFRTVFMFFKISHGLLILAVGILASAFVTRDSNVVFLFKVFHSSKLAICHDFDF